MHSVGLPNSAACSVLAVHQIPPPPLALASLSSLVLALSECYAFPIVVCQLSDAVSLSWLKRQEQDLCSDLRSTTDKSSLHSVPSFPTSYQTRWETPFMLAWAKFCTHPRSLRIKEETSGACSGARLAVLRVGHNECGESIIRFP
ncbi:hypothetical protein DFH94DRAFT_122274 [Russula ochroleuca]|jgi:hypothetical protein|uniref:Uncharacterized protein n=1 Tax=Russula ochroleuca TaxID=152965 RepID=A0A9P5T5Z9_9AGAM|nr:hypothetical protein DFH94DRAFT_122274 [Russula ochroleuca]